MHLPGNNLSIDVQPSVTATTRTHEVNRFYRRVPRLCTTEIGIGKVVSFIKEPSAILRPFIV
jgi:hypothetical protein